MIAHPRHTETSQDLDELVLQDLRAQLETLYLQLGWTYSAERFERMSETCLRMWVDRCNRNLADKPRRDDINAKITAKEVELGLSSGCLVRYIQNCRMEYGIYRGMQFTETRGRIHVKEADQYTAHVRTYGTKKLIQANKLEVVSTEDYPEPTIENLQQFLIGIADLDDTIKPKRVDMIYNHHLHELRFCLHEGSGFTELSLLDCDPDYSIYAEYAWYVGNINELVLKSETSEGIIVYCTRQMKLVDSKETHFTYIRPFGKASQ